MIKIVVWSDYACPYCYIGEARLKKAIKELNLEQEVDIELKAFELNPDAAEHSTETTLERFALKYRLSREQAAAQIEKISAQGRAEGIDFRYMTTLNTNTFKAHRLTKYARERGGYPLADRVAELLFDAYFTKNLELANPETLLGVAEAAGIERSEVEALLASDKFASEVRRDEQEAALSGVRGVPYFVINDEVTIPGALSVNAFKRALLEGLEKQEQDAQESAAQCGPDGCAWEPKPKAEGADESATQCGPDGCAWEPNAKGE